LRAERLALLVESLQFSWLKNKPTLDIGAFEVLQGSSVFLHGPSGSGKSTFLKLIAGLLLPQHGKVICQGIEISNLSEAKRDRFRADHLGFIFQQFNLISYLNGLENIELALEFSPARRLKVNSPRARAQELGEELGLEPKDLRRPVGELSIGQQQRVAAARALIGDPSLIIADEPTSALDTSHRDQFVKLLLKEASRIGSAILFVSHDRSLEKNFDVSVDLTLLNQVATREPA
jgi:putative ABC transport system ATP-binding protein